MFLMDMAILTRFLDSIDVISLIFMSATNDTMRIAFIIIEKMYFKCVQIYNIYSNLNVK